MLATKTCHYQPQWREVRQLQTYNVLTLLCMLLAW